MKNYYKVATNKALLEIRGSYDILVSDFTKFNRQISELYYKIQVDLIPLVALVRIYCNDYHKDVLINCFSYKDCSCKSNCGIKPFSVSIIDICNVVLHRQSAYFSDNKKVQVNTIIYHIKSDKLCEECKKTNGYGKNTKYLDATKSHLYTNTCTCEYNIDFADLLNKIKILLN